MLSWWSIFTAAVYPISFTDGCDTNVTTSRGQMVVNVAIAACIMVVTISLVAGVILGKRLAKQENDAFGLLRELRIILITAAIVLVSYTPDFFASPGAWWGPFIVTIGAAIVLYPTIILPVIQSYIHQSQQRKHAGELQRVKTVEELLLLPQGLELFSQYCQTV